jgi:hypothetical protein
LLLAAVLFFALPVFTASAAAPPGSYFNGFEVNTAGWFNYSGATIKRVPSFYASSNGYATGVPSAAGNYHARLGIDPSPDTCASGGGPQPVYYGPYTNWGGESAIFPPGGYTTKLDIYLDTNWATSHFDRRFDWDSAINDPDGNFRRDFVFNVGTEPGGFVISASNNGTRCGAFPANPGRTPIHIVQSGWYTFQHEFVGVEGGPLAVRLSVIDKATNTTLGMWLLTDPSDIIGATVGGNAYGWFVQNEIDELAIDNSERTGILSTAGCEIKISDGGSITALNTDQGTFGGNAKVSLTRSASGQQTYHDHGPVQPLDFKATTVDAVRCSDDRTSAEIYGTGAVNGVDGYEYRIRLHDGGEPSSDDRYEILIPLAGYYSGDRTLDGGNVQIR